MSESEETPFILFAIRGDYFNRLTKDPETFCKGDWRVPENDPDFAPSLRRSRGLTDVENVSSGETDRALIAADSGWTFVSLAHKEIVWDAHAFAARLAGQLETDVFLISSPMDWAGQCWIGLFDRDYRTVRFLQHAPEGAETWETEAGKPLEIESELPELWSQSSALEMLRSQGAPDWICDRDRTRSFERSALYELDHDTDWIRSDSLMRKLMSPDWFAPVERGRAQDWVEQGNIEDVEVPDAPRKTNSSASFRNGIVVAAIIFGILVLLGPFLF